MDQKYLQQIAQHLGTSMKQVTAVESLSSAGSTIPFMARYRKEATGNLDEVVIGDIVEQIAYYEELQKRKDTIIKTIAEAGKLSDALNKRIDECLSATELEDIYLPFKPKRKTRASQAIERGLEPLATLLWAQGAMEPGDEALPFVKGEVGDAAAALQGARDIMAEWISEKGEARESIRDLFARTAQLHSKPVTAKEGEEDAQKYRDYFSFSSPLHNCPSHRVLAIRRGEKEGFLLMDITIEKEAAVEALEHVFVKAPNAAGAEVKRACEDAYNRLLKASIENEFRAISKAAADEEAIHVFAENLRQLLLASPLGSKKILALDPGYRTGCKLVCLDAQGTLVFNTTIYPHPPQNSRSESVAELKRLAAAYDIEAIGIGNGTAGRETEALVREIDFGRPVSVFQVNESGASIYSASEAAREEFPDHDVTVRGAISIGRRLLDPLSELVKIDPKSIGVGQYQHDVNALKLKGALDRVVESAVNYVGVNVNTASKHLLQYVSGISSTLAANIVHYRTVHGAFKSRTELKKVPLMGAKAFEQCAGFLRIPGAKNLLDASSVHPESYFIVEQMAKDVQAGLDDLIAKPELRKAIRPAAYISETAGIFTIEDILKELEKPGRDPRAPIEAFEFEATIKKIEDVKPGMKVPGIITNITAFGAFVDIGVKQDGLVHLSQLANKYVADPNKVVKLNQKVMVTVTDVDVSRKRIALTMKDAAPLETAPTRERGSIAAVKKAQAPKEPLNSFQSKLVELKNRFKD